MKKKYNSEEEKKEAKRLYDIEYRKINNEKIKETNKIWRINNPDKVKENNKNKIVNLEKEKIRLKEYRENNKEKIKEYNKTYCTNNSKKIKNIAKKYRENNKEKVKESDKNYRENNKNKINIYRRERRKNDDLYRITSNIRGLIRQSFRYKGLKKNTLSEKILGCSFEDFKNHLESLWEPWMNWDNYGLYEPNKLNYGWDIDHIIPLKTGKTEEDIIKLNHYSNLQPLCSYTNRNIKMDDF